MSLENSSKSECKGPSKEAEGSDDPTPVAQPVVTLTPCPTSKPGFLLKPRDIPVLTLKDVQGIESESRLDRFLEQVEGCCDEDQDRIRVGQTRVESAIATLIQA